MPDDKDPAQAPAALHDEQATFEFTAAAAADLPLDVDAALRATLDDVLTRGRPLAAQNSKRGPSREQLHYTTGMANPRARIGINPARRLNLVGAIARFVWMVGASDRLEDIAYYEEQVRPFTDNEISVPGSSYGRRIFESAAGLNQIHGAVERLQKDPDSRQSAVVVWAPTDAVRDSADIPCTFGFFYHVRGGELVASTIMRSNNACILLPYNFFEFSLLAEVVAAAVGVPFGKYVHWAASMHVYDGAQETLATQVLDGLEVKSTEMPPIPWVTAGDPSQAMDNPNYALEQVRRLAALEPRLRNASTREDFTKILTSAGEESSDMWLNEYWRAMFKVLAAWGAAKRGWWDIATNVMDELPDYFAGARFTIENKNNRPAETGPEAVDASGELDLDLTAELPVIGAGYAAVHAATNPAPEISAFQEKVENACNQWEATHNKLMTLAEMQYVRETVYRDYSLAARSQPTSTLGGSVADRDAISDDAISKAVQEFHNQPG